MSDADIRDAFFDEFYKTGSTDSDVMFLSSDMDAFSLRKFKTDFPNQFINVGVAEQNMINVAAGLALSGKKVFCYGIAAFVTMRCFEQIKVNICSLNLPVAIIGAGAGFSFGYDGPTHHGLQDMAIMRLLPEMSVFNLSSNDLAKASVRMAYKSEGPVYIRLDKGPFPTWDVPEDGFSKGYRILRPLKDFNLVTSGLMTCRAVEVADAFHKEIGVVDVYRIKPFPQDFQNEVLSQSKHLVTIEENTLVGGLGTAVSEIITSGTSTCRLTRLAAPDQQFIEYGTRDWFHKRYSLDKESLIQRVESIIRTA